ncbi:MAG: nucleotidyltransferase substrate binding protein [Bdellovibrionota bacterium]
MKKQKIELTELKRALARLKEALALKKTDIIRDSVIQRFEFTVELSWKVLQKFLQFSGLPDPLTPKNAIRDAARINLISDPQAWIEFIDARNLSSHTYKEALAEQVYESAKKLPTFADELLASIEKKLT